jgi:hypothetical protein
MSVLRQPVFRMAAAGLCTHHIGSTRVPKLLRVAHPAELQRLSPSRSRSTPALRSFVTLLPHRRRGPVPVCAWAPDAPSSYRSVSSNSTAILNQTTSFLRNLNNGAEIFLVGTAHVSQRSAEEVKELIDVVRPDAVMVELCAQRAAKLRSGHVSSEGDLFREAFGSLFAPGANFGQQLFKLSFQGKQCILLVIETRIQRLLYFFRFVYNKATKMTLGFAFTGLYRFMRSLGLDPGAEFKAAMEAAERHGARIIYGDRDVQQTMARLAESVRLEDIIKLFGGKGPNPPQAMVDFFESHNGSQHGSGSGFEAQVEALKTRKMARQMSSYLREVSPALAAALIDERDDALVETLRGLKGRVVGVVGLAHLDGIERRWESLHGSQAAVIPARGLYKGTEKH